MQIATRISTTVAVLFLGISAILTVTNSLVDFEAGECPAGCLISGYATFTLFLNFLGVLGLIGLGLLAAVQAGRQHAWGAGMAFPILIALSIWGALAIVTSNTLGFLILNQYPLYAWLRSVTPALLVVLALLPGLALSLNPIQWASSAPVKVLTGVAVGSLLLAGAALWYFEIRSRQTDGATTLAAAPQLLGAIMLFLACWLLGNIVLSLSLLRHKGAPHLSVDEQSHAA